MTQIAPESAGAPARLLDEIEEKRMELTNDQLIAEAVEINHAGVKEKTYERYRDHLVHFAQYLASVHERDFYTCRSKHVRLFMAHLERPGGVDPHRSRLTCEWCRVRGYPDGRLESGRSCPTARATWPRSNSCTGISCERSVCLITTPPRWSPHPRWCINAPTPPHETMSGSFRRRPVRPGRACSHTGRSIPHRDACRRWLRPVA
jgi:hypothetical protein